MLFQAGVLSESDSVALIEDSSATGLYSLHALKSKLNNESSSKGWKCLKCLIGLILYAKYMFNFNSYRNVVSLGGLRSCVSAFQWVPSHRGQTETVNSSPEWSSYR